MQTYATRTKRKSRISAEQEPERSVQELPNSLFAGAVPEQTSDPELLSKIKSRQSDIPGRMQAQIPEAEREADSLANGIGVGVSSPEAVRSEMESRLGADLSNVQFHTDSAAEGFADSIGARAYTTGSDIYFGEGGFDPAVAAHELVHTAQQGATEAAAPVTATPMGGVQMIFGWGKRKKRKAAEKEARLQAQRTEEEAAKGRRADTLRAGIATYNSRGPALSKAMGQNLTAKGVEPTEENTNAGLLSRSAQAMMIPGNESYNQRVAAFFSTGGFGSGNATMGENKNDPQKMQEYRDLMKSHVDFFMSQDMSGIDVNDPESLRANMPLLARAGMFNQFFGDASQEIPDIAGSEELTKEVGSRLFFGNQAFSIARAQVAKEQGYANDPSLYTEADYRKSFSSDVNQGLVPEGIAPTEEQTKEKYQPAVMQRTMERNVSRSMGVGALEGATNYQDFMKNKEKNEYKRKKKEREDVIRWNKKHGDPTKPGSMQKVPEKPKKPKKRK